MSAGQDEQSKHPTLRKGYEVLEEYENADPDVSDWKVMEHLAAFGADLTRDRHVVHYLYFVDNASRASVESKLASAGYDLHHGAEHPASVWLKSLIVERVGLVNDEVLAGERALFTALTEAVHGEYDGWEAALD